MVDEPKITLKVRLDDIFQMISNKVTSWSQTPSNDKYPSEKLVKDSLDNHTHNSQISYGKVDSTSTSTVFTTTVPNLTSLVDGTTVMLRNGVVTSASGFTLNVNDLGAKPVYNSMADATRDTTIFNINYTMLFVYDSTRISGGCWICYRGYNSDTNTIAYQIRTNSQKMYATDKTYRYRILLEVDDTNYMPVNLSTSTSADTSKTSTMNTREFRLGGNIIYYSSSSAINQNAQFGNPYLWKQYTFSLGFSFNNTNTALELTQWSPVYMVAEKSATNEGMAKLVSPYYTQSLPNSEDGKLYILLGQAYNTTNIEMVLEHPIYEYKNGKIRLYRDYYTISETDTLLNGKANSSHTHTKSQITDFPTIPSKTSDLTNDSGFLTSHQDISGKEDKSNKVISLDGFSTDTEYPSAKAVYDEIWTDLYGTIQNEYVQSNDLSSVAFSNDYNDLNNLPQLGDLAFVNDVDLSGHDLDELSDNTNLLFSGDYNDLDNKPTIPSKTSDLTNDSGFLTSHQSLSGYLQTSDVKDNLTSTDTDKPLSAKQGKELKTLIDSKEDNIEIFTGSVVRTSSTSAFLKAYTKSSTIEGKIILYKVPNISSIEWTTNVALDYYKNNQTDTFNRKYVYKNGVQLTFGDIESNSWILLAYEGTLTNGQWNLISSSSYVETKKLPTVTSDLIGDYLQTQQGNEVFGVSNNAIDYGNKALTFNTSNNRFYYNKLEGSGEIATIYDMNKTSIKNFSNNETIINKQYNTSKEIKFHYSRTNTTDCDGYIQIGDNDYGIIMGIVENKSTSSITLQDNLSADIWSYSLSNLDDTNSFDISLRLELDTQNIESLQLGDTFHYYLILTVDGIFEHRYSAEVTITQADDVDIFLSRNYISKVIQDTNSRITDLTFSTDDVYVEKADLKNNSINLDSLLADVIDYGMDNDNLSNNPSNVLPTNIVSEWSQSLSDDKAPSEKLTKETIDGYVDGLSWKLVESKNNGQVKVYANDYMVAVSVQDSFSFSANGQTTISTISRQYAPNYQVSGVAHPNVNGTFNYAIDVSGNITIYNYTSFTSNLVRIYVTYPRKSKMS